jgi:hypothetical protein
VDWTAGSACCIFMLLAVVVLLLTAGSLITGTMLPAAGVALLFCWAKFCTVLFTASTGMAGAAMVSLLRVLPAWSSAAAFCCCFGVPAAVLFSAAVALLATAVLLPACTEGTGLIAC